MQFFSTVVLLAATLTGVQAQANLCTSPNFNKVSLEWPKGFGQPGGTQLTASQFCFDVGGQFKADEQKWDCRKYGNNVIKTMIKKVGKVDTQLDGKLNRDWCKQIISDLVAECDMGGTSRVSNWEFSTHYSQTACGK